MLQDDILTRARTLRIRIIGRLPSARAARAWTAIKSSTECRIAPRIPLRILVGSLGGGGGGDGGGGGGGGGGGNDDNDETGQSAAAKGAVAIGRRLCGYGSPPMWL